MKNLSGLNLYIYCMGLLVLLVIAVTGFYSFVVSIAGQYFDIILSPLKFTIPQNIICLIPLCLVLIIHLARRLIR